MNYKFLKVEKNGSIATIFFNRPEKFNALNEEMKYELLDVLTLLEADNSISIIILTGTGENSFISGDDISEFPNRDKKDFKLLQDLHRSPVKRIL